jgi:hypothetical protein
VKCLQAPFISKDAGLAAAPFVTGAACAAGANAVAAVAAPVNTVAILKALFIVRDPSFVGRALWATRVPEAIMSAVRAFVVASGCRASQA